MKTFGQTRHSILVWLAATAFWGCGQQGEQPNSTGTTPAPAMSESAGAGLATGSREARIKDQMSPPDGGAAPDSGVPPTITATGTTTISTTHTQSATTTTTVTGTGTLTSVQTDASHYYPVSATATATDTAYVYYFSWTRTGTATATNNKTATASTTSISVGTKSTIATNTVTNPYNGTETKTVTGSVTVSGTLTGTPIATVTVTANSTNPTTGVGTHTYAGTGTKTLTATGSNTGNGTQSWTYHPTGTVTNTVTGTIPTTVTGTQTSTGTVTFANACVGTWAFCDNFETGNGSDWTVRQGPAQSFSVVLDGSKVYRQNDATASQLYISQAQGGVAWMDSTIEANLKPLSFSSSSALVSLWGRYDATSNADCGYYVGLRGDGQVLLGKRVVGVSSTLGSPVAVPGGISAGTWYDVKLDMQGTTLKAYVNGTQLLTQTDSACTSGSAGVGSVGASFESDDVRVTAPSTNACVQNWAASTCGAFCTYEATVQSDRAGCGAFLDCYASNGCSPETCGGQDDVCGVNRPGLNTWGTASKEVADQVYKCMGCAGSVNCANPKYYNGTVCADGSACTWGDTCQSGACVPDTSRTTQCSAADQCHGAGTCDTTTGICNNPPVADNLPCNDSSACTPTDLCESGVCTGQNPKVCPASDQCHVGVCNPEDGECGEQPSPDGTVCNDNDACTQSDTCVLGTCTGGDPVVCTTDDACHTPGTCDTGTGVCSDPTQVDEVGCDITLRFDGIVDMGNNTYTVLFGHTSTATTDFHPTSNQVFLNGELQSNPQPAPPYDLAPRNHPGSFLPTLTIGQTVTWTVDGHSVQATVSATSAPPTQEAPTPIAPTPIGTGSGVVTTDGVTIMVTPDMSPYQTTPSDPTVTPSDPVGAAFRGALTGQLTVGPTGQTIYTVPISIPPGVAGMAPNLNLVYNSQGLNGIAGQGWSVSGLSVIYRCPKTKTQDGYAQPTSMEVTSVADDTGDGVCLDGNRLYKAGATQVGSTPFKSEFEDFSTITLSQPNNNFRVVTKSGEIRTYGWNPNAQVSFPREDSNGTKQSDQVVGIWALDKVIDTWGNFYEIHYNDAPSTNGLMVSEIDYTGHYDAEGVQDSPPFYTVTFDYESRTDARTVRFRDSTMPANQRLKTITSNRGAYTLTYKDDGNSVNASDTYMLPSRLAQIDYCSTLGDPTIDCLKPLVFDWDGGGFSWVGAPDYALPSSVDGTAGVQFVDLDGDGRLDVVYGRYNKSYPYINTLFMWRNTGKVTSTCSADPGSTDCNWDSSGAAWEQHWYMQGGPMLADRQGVPQGTIFADFDGDGLPDLITDSWVPNGGPNWDPSGNGVAYIWPVSGMNLADGSTGMWGQKVADALAQASVPTLPGGQRDWVKIDLKKDKVVDIDGDGRAEIVHFGTYYVWPEGPLLQWGRPIYVLRYQGGAWSFDTSYSISATIGGGDYKFCDLNRDGLPDLCGPKNMLNTGSTARGDNGTVWKSTTIATPDPPGYLATGDIDGDGQYDQVVRNGEDDPKPAPVSNVAFSAGPGFTTEGAGDYLGSPDIFVKGDLVGATHVADGDVGGMSFG